MNKSLPTLYLASRSPRRLELLRSIGALPEVLKLRENQNRGLDVDETPLPGEAPDDYVQRVTLAKALAGINALQQRHYRPGVVIAADTSVVIDGHILGKPSSRAHAIFMLQQLSGRHHEVLTAISVMWNKQTGHCLQRSIVHFRSLQDDEIERYVETGEPMDKAGAYAIQGLAAIFIAQIEGSYSGVMGLPLFETAELLSHAGLSLL